GGAVGGAPIDARGRAADPPVARLADGRPALSLLSRGARRLLDPLRRLADSTLRTMAPNLRGGPRALASTLGGGRRRPDDTAGARGPPRARRAAAQPPVAGPHPRPPPSNGPNG